MTPIANLLKMWYKTIPGKLKKVLGLCGLFLLLTLAVNDLITILGISDVWRFVFLLVGLPALSLSYRYITGGGEW